MHCAHVQRLWGMARPSLLWCVVNWVSRCQEEEEGRSRAVGGGEEGKEALHSPSPTDETGLFHAPPPKRCRAASSACSQAKLMPSLPCSSSVG